MAKPNRLVEIEANKGKLKELIPNLINELGSAKAAAKLLGVTDSTISRWLKANGYKPKIVYIKSDERKGESA